MSRFSFCLRSHKLPTELAFFSLTTAGSPDNGNVSWHIKMGWCRNARHTLLSPSDTTQTHKISQRWDCWLGPDCSLRGWWEGTQSRATDKLLPTLGKAEGWFWTCSQTTQSKGLSPKSNRWQCNPPLPQCLWSKRSAPAPDFEYASKV